MSRVKRVAAKPPEWGAVSAMVKTAKIEDDKVTLNRRDFDRLLDAIENIADAQIGRDAQANRDRGKYLPIDQAERIFAGEHPLRVWREHRGMSLTALAAKAKVQKSYVSEIETGKKHGTAVTLKALATALGLTVDDLIR